MPSRERGYQKRIEDALTLYGWKWWHVPSPMRWDPRRKTWVPAKEAAGLCDIIATHHDPPRLLFLEIKGEKGKLSDNQIEFLQAVKIVAERAMSDDPFESAYPALIGVHAVWPKDEDAVMQMLRTRVVA